jgi:hypothetical protein
VPTIRTETRSRAHIPNFARNDRMTSLPGESPVYRTHGNSAGQLKDWRDSPAIGENLKNSCPVAFRVLD